MDFIFEGDQPEVERKELIHIRTDPKTRSIHHQNGSVTPRTGNDALASLILPTREWRGVT